VHCNPVCQYQGCFDLTQLDGLRSSDPPAQFVSYSISKCAGYCRTKGAPFNAITPNFECRCLNVIPAEAARAPDAACGDKGAGAALFYNHADAGEATCRVANVPMEKNSFNFHYNDNHASFDNGVMTIKMVGRAAG
jgi:hypothetical protein